MANNLPQNQFVAKSNIIGVSAQASLKYQQNVALVREKLRELGPGPFTPEQQKLRDSYLHYLSKENIMAANVK